MKTLPDFNAHFRWSTAPNCHATTATVAVTASMTRSVKRGRGMGRIVSRLVVNFRLALKIR